MPDASAPYTWPHHVHSVISLGWTACDPTVHWQDPPELVQVRRKPLNGTNLSYSEIFNIQCPHSLHVFIPHRHIFSGPAV
eukprot:167997-Chlamydomonas_euryale.AAC.1